MAVDKKSAETDLLKELLLSCVREGRGPKVETVAPKDPSAEAAPRGAANLNIRPKLLPTAVQRRLNAASKITFDTHEVYPATKPGERPPNEIELVT